MVPTKMKCRKSENMLCMTQPFSLFLCCFLVGQMTTHMEPGAWVWWRFLPYKKKAFSSWEYSFMTLGLIFLWTVIIDIIWNNQDCTISQQMLTDLHIWDLCFWWWCSLSSNKIKGLFWVFFFADTTRRRCCWVISRDAFHPELVGFVDIKLRLIVMLPDKALYQSSKHLRRIRL